MQEPHEGVCAAGRGARGGSHAGKLPTTSRIAYLRLSQVQTSPDLSPKAMASSPPDLLLEVGDAPLLSPLKRPATETADDPPESKRAHPEEDSEEAAAVAPEPSVEARIHSPAASHHPQDPQNPLKALLVVDSR